MLEGLEKWAKEGKGYRSVKIEVSNCYPLSIWVYDGELQVGQFVKSVEDIDLEGEALLKQKREYEKLKAKFEPKTI